MLTIAKDKLVTHIQVGSTSEDSPTALPGWKEWMDSVWKQATDAIPIVASPKVGRGEVKNLAQISQPVRFALVNGCKHMDFTGLMFHGWVPSEFSTN